jgi:hypothetical protein
MKNIHIQCGFCRFAGFSGAGRSPAIFFVIRVTAAREREKCMTGGINNKDSRESLRSE